MHQNKIHWETVYETKNPDQVSWTQEKPTTTLGLIQDLQLDKYASIIDIGGGDSKLVDYLIEEGYENITVLDISSKALEKAQIRLGENAKKITWIVSDILDFQPTQKYDLWHDRAVFHFLTRPTEIDQYLTLVNKFVNKNLIIATFSDSGPLKCSGLEVSRYNEEKMTAQFKNNFDKIICFNEDHITPFKTSQNFLYGSFKKK